MRRFDPELVEAELVSTRKRSQVFQGRRTRGLEQLYEVKDGNFDTRNAWRFVVFVPDRWLKGTYVSVQPQVVPNRKLWAGLDRRSVQFAPCTMAAHRGKCYAKLAFADVTDEKNRVVLARGEALPRWMRSFRTRSKTRVTATRARDGHALVAILEKDDWVGMICLFLALKPWALFAGFSRDN
jgi:hypothetical protein